MKDNKCFYEKITLRTVGIILLPLVIFFTVVANIVLPFFGTLFVIPFLALIWVLLKAPKSKTCKLLLADEG